jgi:hypothetical protein
MLGKPKYYQICYLIVVDVGWKLSNVREQDLDKHFSYELVFNS